MVQETAGGSVVADEEMLAPEIDGSFVPRLRPQVVSVEIEGGSVIFLEGTASVHRFDRLAAIVLSCFDGSATLDERIADLRDLFGADPDVVRSDVLELTRRIERAGLLEGVAESLPSPGTGPSRCWPGRRRGQLEAPLTPERGSLFLASAARLFWRVQLAT